MGQRNFIDALGIFSNISIGAISAASPLAHISRVLINQPPKHSNSSTKNKNKRVVSSLAAISFMHE